MRLTTADIMLGAAFIIALVAVLSPSNTYVQLQGQNRGPSESSMVDFGTAVTNDSFDFSVEQVTDFIKANVRYPESYEVIGWSEVQESFSGEYAYFVRHQYKLINDRGNIVSKDQVFYLDTFGNVTDFDDFDK